ncbi:MAG: endonuclease/exonuclease/phosphatase family protein [Lachnospiraceae bacterium]|nr:endonuclease/exonuclease/phosphatase family protein [Lachnospiraceae bacterium]
MKIKVMSFNVQHCMNYISRKIDFDCFADAIREVGADIVGLNEIRGEGEDREEYQEQAKILAEKLGFHYYFAEAIKFQGVNPYGNALISRYPIVSVEKVMVPDPEVRGYDGYYETRCLLKAKLDVNGERLTVCVIHFGLNPDEKENAAATVLKSIEDEKCVLMGDFNMTPDNPLFDPIRARLYDTAELFKEPLLSCPSDFPTEKIDYIFTSRDIKVHSADIPAMIVSDHRPYLAEIEL